MLCFGDSLYKKEAESLVCSLYKKGLLCLELSSTSKMRTIYIYIYMYIYTNASSLACVPLNGGVKYNAIFSSLKKTLTGHSLYNHVLLSLKRAGTLAREREKKKKG